MSYTGYRLAGTLNESLNPHLTEQIHALAAIAAKDKPCCCCGGASGHELFTILFLRDLDDQSGPELRLPVEVVCEWCLFASGSLSGFAYRMQDARRWKTYCPGAWILTPKPKFARLNSRSGISPHMPKIEGFASFLASAIEKTDGSVVLSSQLHRVYLAWAKERGEDFLTNEELFQAMHRRGFNSIDCCYWFDQIALTKEGRRLHDLFNEHSPGKKWVLTH